MKDPMPSGSGTNNSVSSGMHMNHQMPEMQINMNPVHVRETENYHHHYISMQQRPPPSVQQPAYCYNQPYPTLGPMPNCSTNHDSLRTYIKQNNPAFLSIAQSSQQAYSGKQRNKNYVVSRVN